MKIQVFWEHSEIPEDLSLQQQHFAEPQILHTHAHTHTHTHTKPEIRCKHEKHRKNSIYGSKTLYINKTKQKTRQYKASDLRKSR